ncbi:MAG: SUMF1/EgtB/PvdO family nonheme iron enzyme [Bacteroidaceae bacterium]|nr:SUMF1/EgtB/PvdO family nonheme iron enzyme [Bacteroidaceae bacterium]
MKRLYILIAALLMLGVRASWADVLTANVLAYDKNGEETVIKMKYEVLDESAKTCCIYGTYSERAIDPDFTGSIALPSKLGGYTVTEIGEFAFNRVSATILSLPENLQVIRQCALSYVKIEPLTLPASLQFIDYAAFSSTDIKSVVIPKGVTQIKSGCFIGCNFLESIQVEEGNTAYESPDGCNAIIRKDHPILVQGCKNTIIPSNITEISDFAFRAILSLKSIAIPDKVQKIGFSTFSRTGLETLILPKSVQIIDSNAFDDCNNLKRIDYYGTSLYLFENVFGTESVPSKPKSVYLINDPTVSATDKTFEGAENVTFYVPDRTKWLVDPWLGWLKPSQIQNLKTINQVDITGLDKPVHGAQADFDVDCTTEGVKELEVRYAVGIGDNGDFIYGDPSPFQAKRSYIVIMRIVPDEGYVFPDGAKAYVDGEEWTLANSIGYYTIGNLLPTPIPDGGIPVDTIAANVVDPVPGDDALHGLVYPIDQSGKPFFINDPIWTEHQTGNSVSTFESDKTYTVCMIVTFDTSSDYAITDQTVFTINDNPAYITSIHRDSQGKINELCMNYTWYNTRYIKKGDVNGDRSVNTADVVAIYSFIENGDASGFTRDDANVNGDKNGDGIAIVNTADVVAAYDAIINGAPDAYIIDGVPLNIIEVKGGKFFTGTDVTWVESKVQPRHEVTVDNFAIGQTEVTQALWQAVMGYNPSNHVGDDLPVERVSWRECLEFANRLNSAFADQLGDRRFRLPTEAEWEYAARGGHAVEKDYLNRDNADLYAGNSIIANIGWYGLNSDGESHPVASLAPNELGTYDMSGNVAEWCYDWYSETCDLTDTDNPSGPAHGTTQVVKGGSYDSYPRYMRIFDHNNGGNPTVVNQHIGFRLVISPRILKRH